MSALIALLLVTQSTSAQGQPAEQETPVFIDQADQSDGPSTGVYWPEPIRRPDPIELRQPETAQITRPEEQRREVSQLTDTSLDSALAQLSEAERQVLIQAVEGTDICERETQVAAVIELCRRKLENRSDEFAVNRRPTLSPEERLLGEGLDGDRLATVEGAIGKLARGQGSPDQEDVQVIASIALAPSSLPAQAASQEETPESQLSAETQALINAIVESLSAAGGN